MAEANNIQTPEFKRRIFLKEYYSSNIPLLLPDYKHRKYKFKLFDNKWIYQKRINTSKDLKDCLLKYLPKDVYQSVSTFVNPEKISLKKFYGKRAGFINADCLILDTHFVIDLDGHDIVKKEIKSPEVLYDELLKIYDILNSRFSDFLFVRTGRGFHTHVFDFNKIMLDKRIENPMQRINYFEQKKRSLLKEIYRKFKERYGYDLVVCSQTSIDSWRIVRVPFSVHNNGTVCYATDSPYDKKLLNPERLFS